MSDELRTLKYPGGHQISYNFLSEHDQKHALNILGNICHEANKKWWLDLKKPCPDCDATGKNMFGDAHDDHQYQSGRVNCERCGGHGYALLDRNIGEMLMLCVSELAESMEGHRKDLMDDKLPHRKQFEVELADCLIRIFDLAVPLKLDLGGAFIEKMAYNAQREDHTIAHRLGAGGKKY